MTDVRNRSALTFLLTAVAGLGLSIAAQERPELALQSGHSTYVSGLAFTPDGNFLISGSNDCTVRLWDVRAYREVRLLTRHSREVSAVAVCPDGRCFLSAGVDIAINVGRLPDGQQLRLLRGHTQTVKELVITQDGRYLFSASGDPPNFDANRASDFTIRAWDLKTGQALRRFTGHRRLVSHIAIAGRLLASSSSDNTVKVWDITSGETLATVGGFKYAAYIAFTRDGQWLITSSEHGVELRDPRTLRVNKQLSTDAHAQRIATSPVSPFVAYATSGRIRLIDPETGRDGGTLSLPENGGYSIHALVFSPDGRRIAAGFNNGAIAVWELTTKQAVGDLRAMTTPIETLAVDWSHGWIASGSQVGAPIRIWDTHSGRVFRSFPNVDYQTEALAFSPDGEWLAASGGDPSETVKDRVIKIINVASGAEATTLHHTAKHVYALTWSPDGKCIGSVGDVVARVFSFPGGREVADLRPATRLLALDNACRNALTGSGLGDVTQWALPGGQWRHIRNEVGWAYGLSPNGEWLISTGWYQNFKLLNLQSGQWREFSGHREFVRDIAFGSDNRRLASASWDGDVRLWDISTGRPLQTLKGYSRLVAVAFTRDGAHVLAGGQDGMIRVWSTESGAEELTLISFRSGDDWLVVAPDGLFDGTERAMRQVAWRTSQTGTVPLESLFNDYYYPGLLKAVLEGRRPRAPFDIATLVRVPGLRRMLADDLAHVETRGDTALVCFHDMPSVAVQTIPGEREIETRRGDFRVVPSDASCKYQQELSVRGSAKAFVDAISRPAGMISLPVTQTPVSRSTLHVLTIGISEYRSEADFSRLPFAATSARALEEFFTHQASCPARSYRAIRVWPALTNSSATQRGILEALADIRKSMSPDDVLLIYLAGHGVLEPGEEMFNFIPFDADSSQLNATAISTATLATVLREMSAERIVLLIDTCQSGAVVEALGRVRDQFGAGIHIAAASLPLAYAVQPMTSNRSPLVMAVLESLTAHRGAVRASEVIAFVRTRLPVISQRTTRFTQHALTVSVGADFVLPSN